jgi:hypothetical protein
MLQALQSLLQSQPRAAGAGAACLQELPPPQRAAIEHLLLACSASISAIGTFVGCLVALEQQAAEETRAELPLQRPVRDHTDLLAVGAFRNDFTGADETPMQQVEVPERHPRNETRPTQLCIVHGDL